MRNNYKTDENIEKRSKLELLKRILTYFSPYKARIGIITTMIVAMTFIVVFIPILTEYAIDVNIYNKDVYGLIITTLLGLLLLLLWWALSVIKMHMLARISNEIVYKVREDAYASLMRQAVSFFDTRPSGKIIARLVGDMDGFKTITQSLVNELVPNLLLLVMILAIMSAKNIVLSISAFAVVPIMAVASFLIIYKGYPNWERFRKKESNHTAFAFESFSGVKTIQSFMAEDEANREEERLLDEIKTSWNKAVRFSDSLYIFSLFSQGVGYFILFFVAIFILRYDSSSIGEVLAYVSYLSLFWQPIRSLATMYTQLVNNLASAERVFELIDHSPELVQIENAHPLSVEKGDVEFRNVSFSYPDERERNVLSNLSFSVSGGSRIALVGPTGAGKTTIVNLISRFYDPTEGAVLIDGQDISKVTIESLRKSVMVMPQESMLFTGTIRDNLLYGLDCSKEEMIKKCKMLSIDGFISSLKNGYDTQIKDASLSAGQKQLIALARTLIASPKIVILDEATSNVDTNTELLVQEGVDILTKGRTAFIVAHRLSTIKNSDQIFVVSDKGIMERGSHEELMKRGGEYKALYDAQFDLVKS